ncbi:MAG: alpha-mannosidase [Lachnospiraceae bacterium]
MILMKERIGKLIETIGELIYEKKIPVQEYRMKKTDGREPDSENPDASDWQVVTGRHIWGGHREYYQFYTEFTVPEELAGRQLVYELRTGREGAWDAVNPQFLVYVNGTVKQGFDVNHRETVLTDSARAGETFRIFLSAFTGDNNFSLLLDSEIKVTAEPVYRYYWDIKVPYEAARLQKADSDAYIDTIQALNKSLNLVDLRAPYSAGFYRSIENAETYLQKNYYDKCCGDSRHMVYTVGHTHIDLAWLWTLQTTADKTVRSFSTVLELMRRYPEYRFMHSQPQEYLYVKQNAPEIYEQVKERIKEGRWQPEGGMWVEADCNLTSGESLVRQFLYGCRFFQKEFDKKCEILWLPDVFGYSAALPQIMQQCGIRYFMTTKISWNEFNRMPYDTFLWEGIDGTKVLTHFVPCRDYNAPAVEGGTETAHFTTYNGMLNPSQVMGGWQRYSQKDLNPDILMCYGYGDGGGGPTAEMLENQRRLAEGLPGVPKTKQCVPTEFFHELEKQVKGSRHLPEWKGELYLEYHRGTYTTMAKNKRYNRKAEFAYENLEFYSVLAGMLAGTPYPESDLREGWETILRNQFHDIIPGSSIKEVYDESWQEYEKILTRAEELTRQMTEAAAAAIDGDCGDVVVFNPGSSSCVSLITLSPAVCDRNMTALEADGKRFPVQQTKEGLIAMIDQVPGHGYRVLKPVMGGAEKESAEKENADSAVKPAEITYEFTITEHRVDTPYFHIEINEKGQFTSIYDKKADRELLQAGKAGNVLMTYEDRPHNYDAWDINHYYTEKSWEVEQTSEIRVTENGPVRACIRVVHPYGASEIVQYLYFYPDQYRFDIRNEIDWHENHVLLRDYFPVDIHTNEAVFDIQYGNVKRPTHYNTSWDFAKFEVCAHKWLDVSEDNYGISVLNDCKYGYSVHDSVIGLTMLKSSTYPNPEADRGHHTFSYSFCPHIGDFRIGGTVAKAYAFNNPCRAVVKQEKTEKGTASVKSLISVDVPNVVIEAVKKAEDDESLIVRCYECFNRRSKVTMKVDAAITGASVINLLEDQVLENLEIKDGTISFTMKPYEIRTIKFEK